MTQMVWFVQTIYLYSTLSIQGHAHCSIQTTWHSPTCSPLRRRIPNISSIWQLSLKKQTRNPNFHGLLPKFHPQKVVLLSRLTKLLVKEIKNKQWLYRYRLSKVFKKLLRCSIKNLLAKSKKVSLNTWRYLKLIALTPC